MTLSRRNLALRSPRQRTGAAAEQAACARLEAAGCHVVARNVSFREGELDIVARDGATLVFVEVRMRASDRFGGAAASVDRFKQRRLTRAAQLYLMQTCEHQPARGGQRPAQWPACRFDVIVTDGAAVLEWIKDAFSEA